MVDPPVEDSVATAAAGYGRAFGRVEYVEGGKVVAMSAGFLESTSLKLFVRSLRTAKIQYMDIAGDGSFVWPLETGEYVIVGFQFLRLKGSRSSRSGRMMATFSVPQAGQAAYVGDLRIDRAYRVIDDYDQALARVAAKLADGNFQPVKSMLRFERPPGRYSAVVPVCNERWELPCGEEYKGVEPVEPRAVLLTGALRFPTTKSLAPLLEWKPASRAGVTYDVVIHESLSLQYGMAGVDGLQGAVVAYAEGLAEPRFTPAPLEPGRRYQWSVRLREGDLVSSWSSVTYNLFILVAGASGSGQAFGFETPAAR